MSAEVDQNASGIGNKQVGRRSIAKGVAWSVPVLAVGSTLSMASASGAQCPTCFTPSAGLFAATALLGPNKKGPLVITSPFLYDPTACADLPFIDLFAVLGTSTAVLTYNGATYTASIPLTVGVSLGSIGTIVPALVFPGVQFTPNGDGSYPPFAAKICLNLNLRFKQKNGDKVKCQVQLCYTVSANITASVSVLGITTLTFVGTTTGA